MLAKKLLSSLVLAFLMMHSNQGFAQNPVDGCDVDSINLVKKNLAKTLTATKINEIKCSAINGFYQVTAGENLFYTDRDVSYLFVGGFYSLKEGRDVTGVSLKASGTKVGIPGATPSGKNKTLPTKISSKGLPKTPIKYGSSKKVVYLFSDPNCTFCLRAHFALKKLIDDGLDISIHELPFGLLPGSEKNASAIWCSKEPKKALADHFMGEGQNSACEKGTKLHTRIKDAFLSRGFTGTPMFLAESGEKFTGWPQDRSDFLTWVEKLGDDGSVQSDNLTNVNMLNEKKISWSDIPTNPIIHGDIGATKVAIFSHPNCNHCRRLHKSLSSLSGFEFNEYITSPNLDQMVQGIYCSEKPVEKLKLAMSGKKFTVNLKDDCGIKEQLANQAFVKKNGIGNSPIFIREDGSVKQGFSNLNNLHNWLISETDSSSHAQSNSGAVG